MSYKVVVIGTGFGRVAHLPAYSHHEKFEPIGVCGRNFEKTKEVASKFGIKAYKDWKQIIVESNCDIVSIATPPYLHYEMAKFALEHKKHILLEKPTTSTAEQARMLVQLSQEHDVCGMIAHEMRYWPQNQKIKELLEIGEIGEVQEIHYQDLLRFVGPQDRYDWESREELTGGWIGIAGSHLIDMIRYMAGSEIYELQGKLRIQIPWLNDNGEKKAKTADDGFFSIMTMKNGIDVVLDHSPSFVTPPPSRIIFKGTEGVIYGEGGNALYPTKLWISKGKEEYIEIVVDAKYNLPLSDTELTNEAKELFVQLDDFVEMIETGKPKGPTLYDGYQNQKFIDAMRESNKTGSRIRVNL